MENCLQNTNSFLALSVYELSFHTEYSFREISGVQMKMLDE